MTHDDSDDQIPRFEQHAGIVVGPWHGTVAFDVPVPMVLRVALEGDVLSASADYPQLRSASLPVREFSFDAGRVRFATRSLGDFVGRVSDDGACIEGAFSKDDRRFALVLHRGEAPAAAPRRPQTPRAPFPYAIEDVAIERPEAGCRLAGTLTFPPAEQRRSVVLLITGSGPMDRDETVFGHKPFQVLADHLARRGHVVLRLDDRGVGASSGDRSAIVPQDEIEDMAAALETLSQRDDLRGLPIGLVAHSMGGVIGMSLAARRDDVAFLVAMGTPGVTLGEAFAARECEAMAAAGAATDAIERHRCFTETLYRELGARATVDRIDAAQIAALAERFGVGEASPAHSAEWIARFNQPWFRAACRLDPAALLARINAPVLAINGSLDVQTVAAQNLPAIARGLAAAGNGDVSVRELPQLNHLFQTAITGAVHEYPAIEETFAPLALQTIGAWLDARFAPRRR